MEASRYPEEDRGYGWIMFAGSLLAMLGTLNVIEGIAAVSDSKFFVHDTKYIVSSLNTWGWVVLVIGALQLLTGFGVMVKNQAARWAGVVFAAANAIAQLMFIPAYPLWTLALFSLDILVMYGLIAYGKRLEV